jgi:hypothetical protein
MREERSQRQSSLEQSAPINNGDSAGAHALSIGGAQPSRAK